MKEMRVCKKCGRNRDAKFYVGTRGRTCATCRKGRTRLASRDTRLAETYGITEKDYQAILAAQDGRCAICRKAYRYNLDVDHWHALEKDLVNQGYEPILAKRMSIRGLLCKRCNRRMLPAAGDSSEILMRAAAYCDGDVQGISLRLTQFVLDGSHGIEFPHGNH
jgi:hypothetical protein